MSRAQTLYLDNAATSFPKPPGVVDAVAAYMCDIGADPGRAGHAASRAASGMLTLCRERAAALLNVESPRQVVFTLNATDALNMAIKGIVRYRLRRYPGQAAHVVATAMDHNSVLRPINELRHEGATWTCVPVADSRGRIDPASVIDAITPDTALVVLPHASNVTGGITEIEPIAQACRSRGVDVLIDAAQAAGHVPIDMKHMGVSLIAASGHKGLMGPLGTGLLLIAPGVDARMVTLREGGTGTTSESDVHPERMPERFEAGSPNAPGIAGLSEALRLLIAAGDAGFGHERALTRRMADGLRARGVREWPEPFDDADGPLAGFRIAGPLAGAGRVGLFSLIHRDITSHELAMVLEAEHGILGRAGVHCAPRAHHAIGAAEQGALRLSVGRFQTERDVDRVLDALCEIDAGSPRRTRIISA